MGIQAFVRALLPREERFYGYLEEQATVAHEAAVKISTFGAGCNKGALRDEVQALEHRGDSIVHEMEDALAKTFVTPLDREDLERLSKQLDDVLDVTNLFARECALFGVEQPSSAMDKLSAKLVECTSVLKQAILRLRRHEYGGITEDSRTIRRLEKEGDAVFREALSALFRDPGIDGKTLVRERSVLHRLETAIDQCDSIAGTLVNVAVKHG
jgi:hypothetical protein